MTSPFIHGSTPGQTARSGPGFLHGHPPKEGTPNTLLTGDELIERWNSMDRNELITRYSPHVKVCFDYVMWRLNTGTGLSGQGYYNALDVLKELRKWGYGRLVKYSNISWTSVRAEYSVWMAAGDVLLMAVDKTKPHEGHAVYVEGPGYCSHLLQALKISNQGKAIPISMVQALERRQHYSNDTNYTDLPNLRYRQSYGAMFNLLSADRNASFQVFRSNQVVGIEPISL